MKKPDFSLPKHSFQFCIDWQEMKQIYNAGSVRTPYALLISETLSVVHYALLEMKK